MLPLHVGCLRRDVSSVDVRITSAPMYGKSFCFRSRGWLGLVCLVLLQVVGLRAGTFTLQNNCGTNIYLFDSCLQVYTNGVLAWCPTFGVQVLNNGAATSASHPSVYAIGNCVLKVRWRWNPAASYGTQVPAGGGTMDLTASGNGTSVTFTIGQQSWYGRYCFMNSGQTARYYAYGWANGDCVTLNQTGTTPIPVTPGGIVCFDATNGAGAQNFYVQDITPNSQDFGRVQCIPTNQIEWTQQTLTNPPPTWLEPPIENPFVDLSNIDWSLGTNDMLSQRVGDSSVKSAVLQSADALGAKLSAIDSDILGLKGVMSGLSNQQAGAAVVESNLLGSATNQLGALNITAANGFANTTGLLARIDRTLLGSSNVQAGLLTNQQTLLSNIAEIAKSNTNAATAAALSNMVMGSTEEWKGKGANAWEEFGNGQPGLGHSVPGGDSTPLVLHIGSWTFDCDPAHWSGWAALASAVRATVTWLIALLFYLDCFNRALEFAEKAMATPQIKTPRLSIFGNSFGTALGPVWIAIIMAAMLALPSILLAIFTAGSGPVGALLAGGPLDNWVGQALLCSLYLVNLFIPIDYILVLLPWYCACRVSMSAAYWAACAVCRVVLGG